ncbi:hypothetical protein D7I39_20370 [Allopusillimonas ginsengisoli]|nr:hypothetical protein D7I39_20370 [Allopusillimonas ginsengisoli]
MRCAGGSQWVLPERYDTGICMSKATFNQVVRLFGMRLLSIPLEGNLRLHHVSAFTGVLCWVVGRPALLAHSITFFAKSMPVLHAANTEPTHRHIAPVGRVFLIKPASGTTGINS